jgi:hypothetical protein
MRAIRPEIGFALALSLALTACDEKPTADPPKHEDPGLWILDSNYTLDEFPFRTDACTEVFPAGSQSADSVPAGTVASVRLVSTACYRLRVRVVNADSDTVRSFETRFGIFNRTENEKNRGVVGFAAWDGKDDQGRDLGAGRFLWRMEFDFGLGRFRRFRADILIP